MSLSPIAQADSLRVGTIDFVSPNEIKVLLDTETPDRMTLNAGVPRPFPRINGYVLIPSDEGHLVGQIEWITIERSQYPKRKGMQDFGLIDLPYPLRKMSLNPLGHLVAKESGKADNDALAFYRGVGSYPTVGDPVFVPTQAQLKAIIESGKNRRVHIGTSPLAADADVMVDPDRLFGRHLAVLGNTGSGKSCSVAGLIRWSLDAAKKRRNGADPNARFIILDPNGEYSNTFRDMETVRVYAVEPDQHNGTNQLQVPLWFWNTAEWSAFTKASGKTQRPLLQRALRDVKAGRPSAANTAEQRTLSLRRYLSTRLISLRRDLKSGAIQTDESKFGYRLKAMFEDLHGKLDDHRDNKLEGILSAIDVALESTHKSFNKNGETIDYYRAFTEDLVNEIISAIEISIDTVGGEIGTSSADEDVPLPFNAHELADYISDLGVQENSTQFIEFLVSRIRTFLANKQLKSTATDVPDLTLEEWLTSYIGASQASNGSITVIDLSLVPAEVVHILTAVIARMTLEALQRYRKLNSNEVLPTTLVMEEAHTFIKRYKDDAENQSSSAACCQVFEKIAREGRKFGLGLVLSSQRPSELSPTVLSQCNSYLLHRISNDRDQNLVQKLVPDNLHGLLRDLPTLPSRQAILLGWASELPILVQMNELSEAQRPKSDDPDFWAVWSGEGLTPDFVKGGYKEREVDWNAIAQEWQAGAGTATGNGEGGDSN